MEDDHIRRNYRNSEKWKQEEKEISKNMSGVLINSAELIDDGDNVVMKEKVKQVKDQIKMKVG